MMKTLSLCMIVRDEEAMLPKCLESVRGWVDEVIVVDTGSTDHTIDVAVDFGARVYTLPWNDDFAEARNFALQYATGDWVLLLDADERLAEGAGALIRAAIENLELECLAVFLHNAKRIDSLPEDVLSGTERHGEPVILPRLFRRTPDLRWRRPIHENVDVWIQGRIDKCATVQADILHYGSVLEYRQKRRKGERNIAILEAYCKKSPTDLAAAAYLVGELLMQGKEDDAFSLTEETWDNLLQTAEEGAPAHPIIKLVSSRTLQMLRRHDFREALRTIETAESWGWSHPEMDYQRGHALELLELDSGTGPANLDMLRKSEQSYLKAYDQRGQPQFEGITTGATTALALLRRGAVSLRMGNYHQADACFTKVLEEYPEHPEAYLGAIECAIALGDYDGALASLIARPASATNRPDPWLMEACVRRNQGNRQAAHALALRACQPHEFGFMAPHRRSILEAFSPEPRLNLVVLCAPKELDIGSVLEDLEANYPVSIIRDLDFIQGLSMLLEQGEKTESATAGRCAVERQDEEIERFVERGRTKFGDYQLSVLPYSPKPGHISLLARALPDSRILLLPRPADDGRASNESCKDRVFSADPSSKREALDAATGSFIQDARHEAVSALGRVLELSQSSTNRLNSGDIERIRAFLTPGTEPSSDTECEQASERTSSKTDRSTTEVHRREEGDRSTPQMRKNGYSARIIVATPMRNEKGRFLEQWLRPVCSLADVVLILDDGSTDGTPEICQEHAANVVVVRAKHSPSEGARRTHLWELISRHATPGDWVLFLDADEIPSEGLVKAADKLRSLPSSIELMKVPLLEMWNESEWRADGFWSPLLPAMIRFRDEPFRNDSRVDRRDLHVPRLPDYSALLVPHPLNQPILHMAYSRRDLREGKSRYYLERNAGIDLHHARTILDERPVLRSLESVMQPPRVLVTIPIRDRAWVLPALFDSLERLTYPPERLGFRFYLNDESEDTRRGVESWCSSNPRYSCRRMRIAEPAPQNPHAWLDTGEDPMGPLRRMAALRNSIVRDFLATDAEVMFSLDSDVLLHPRTLSHLASLGRDIISPVFWAQWGLRTAKREIAVDPSLLTYRTDIAAIMGHLRSGRMPQVWEAGGYELSEDFLADLILQRGLHQVGGLGAATWIHRRVFEAGVHYGRVYNLPSTMVGEDRDFCIRATCAGFPLSASSMLPILHCDAPGDEHRFQSEVLVFGEADWPEPHSPSS
jgi:glycosyltransferase involved in cell wall biosynthesis